MVLYEHSDVIQWGIQLLDGNPGYTPGYYGGMIGHDPDGFYNGHYLHNHCDTEGNQVENDEIIALTLQEEFSKLHIAEYSRHSQAADDQFHASEPAYGWHNSSMMNYCSGGTGHDYAQDRLDDVEPSSSFSGPCNEGDYSLELTDDYPLDDGDEGRLSQMIPVPHVPRINGGIPSVDEATSDHQRLSNRLQLYDFVEHKVQGDGNCQFRALSDQLYHTPEHHEFVRRQVVNQLKSHHEIYEGYVPMDYGDYLDKMSQSGEWGDHVTLQAAADSFGVRIFVMTSFKDTFCIEIFPHFEKPKQVIFLSFWAEVHYNSIYPQGDIPSSESKKKKSWWSFGSKH